MVLNDKNIRSAFIDFINQMSVKPKMVLEELGIHNGNAIADIVTVHKELHCYEIKGETDKIERLIDQGKFYNISFRKITLITTENHIKKALELSPEYWGIILARVNNDQIVFNYIRKSRRNKHFNKESALYSLWRKELLQIGSKFMIKDKKQSRKKLAEQIEKHLTKENLSHEISEIIDNRFKNKEEIKWFE